MAEISSFAAAMQERSSRAHAAGEDAGFMSHLIGGRGTRDDYTSLLVQTWHIYRALEEATERMRADPVATMFISDRLRRLPAITADLEYLLGEPWSEQVPTLPATQRYVQRIRVVAATWPGGFVAHHYTRYLGDLSGSHFIGRLLAKQFGFDTNGIGFYLFHDIADPKQFKQHYREQLDMAPWDQSERDRVIAEVLLAYRLNTEVFAELGARAAVGVA